MVSLKLVVGLVSGLAATVIAHGNVHNFTTDGKYNQGFLRESILTVINSRVELTTCSGLLL
jgi:hypothetical protein